ncbi:MAG: PLP-dependent aminotransferase family protein, partial [Actinomycetota bacterium]
AAARRGLLLAPGPRFSTGHAFDDRLRLPYSQPVDVLDRAVLTLAEVVSEVRAPASDDDQAALVV